MSVTLSPAGVILLSGDCSLQDAEALLRRLSDNPGADVDWSGCDQVHTAVIQILAAARPRMVGSPTDPVVGKHLAAFL